MPAQSVELASPARAPLNGRMKARDDMGAADRPPVQRRGPVRFLIRNFFKGLLVVIPFAATLWILLTIFRWIDELVETPESDYWTIPMTEIRVPLELLAWDGVGFVVEHDARHVPGYDLVQSDFTGRAVFERRNERLEVLTANRRPLERVFGVDLVYLNVTRKNIVMMQYKMLEPLRRDGEETDWIARTKTILDHGVDMPFAPFDRFSFREDYKDHSLV